MLVERSEDGSQDSDDPEEEDEEDEMSDSPDALDQLTPLANRKRVQDYRNIDPQLRPPTAKQNNRNIDPKPGRMVVKPPADLQVKVGNPIQRRPSPSVSGAKRSHSRDVSEDEPDERPHKRLHFATSRLPFSQRKKWDTLSDVIKLDYIRAGPSRQGQESEETLHAELLFRYQCVFGANPPQLTAEQNRWVLSIGARVS